MGVFGGGIVRNDVRRAAVNAALGQTLDGQGDILIYDNFQNGLVPWTPSAAGTGSSIDLSMAQHLTGEFSCRMVTGTGVTLGANIVRPLEFVQLSPMGIEAAFMIDANTGIVDVLLSIGNGTTEFDFTVRVNAGIGQLQFQNSAAAFANVQAFAPSTTVGLFHRIKAVFNPLTALYDRIVLDTQAVSGIVGVAGRQVPNAVSPFLQAAVRAGPAAGVSSTVFIDAVVVTVNELL